jgi:RHS repeat-associated protein
MQMPGSKYSQSNSNYRYGFNGKEKSDEVYGEGNVYDYGARIYNPRLGRFLSVDPMTKSYPLLTPYQFASNSPIWGIDVDGLEFMPYLSAWFHIKTDVTSYTGTAIPFAVSCFDITKTTVVINKTNVSSVYKDANGEPLFDAMGVGITPNGKYESNDYAEIRSPGINNLPQNPDWVFAPSQGLSGVPEDLYSYNQGTAPKSYTSSKGYYSSPFDSESLGGAINNTSSGANAFQEIINYGIMYNNYKLGNASVALNDSKNTFDKVAKIVDATYAENDKSNFNGFNRGDLLNCH